MSTSGKPVPDDGLGVLTTLTVAVLFSGAAFTLVAGHPRRMGGARHSVKLEFEQQKIAMQQAAEAEHQCERANGTTTGDAGNSHE